MAEFQSDIIQKVSHLRAPVKVCRLPPVEGAAAEVVAAGAAAVVVPATGAAVVVAATAVVDWAASLLTVLVEQSRGK